MEFILNFLLEVIKQYKGEVPSKKIKKKLQEKYDKKMTIIITTKTG